MTAEATPDLDPIVPAHGGVVVDGVPCKVRRLRAREMFSLARVLSTGIGEALFDLDLSGEDGEQIQAQLLGMLVVAVPSAGEETLAFFTDMVEPVNPDQAETVRKSMRNPELDTLLDVIEAILDGQGESIVAFVGKARLVGAKGAKLLTDHQRKAGSSGRGRGRSTSSQPSTDGPTT